MGVDVTSDVMSRVLMEGQGFGFMVGVMVGNIKVNHFLPCYGRWDL